MKTNAIIAERPKAKWSQKPPTEAHIGQWFLYVEYPDEGDGYFGYGAHVGKVRLNNSGEINIGDTSVSAVIYEKGWFYGPIGMAPKLQHKKADWEW